MIHALIVAAALLGQADASPVAAVDPVLTTQSERLATPATIYQLIAVELAETPPERRYETRFITHWPYKAEQIEEAERVLLFWLPSLSHRRQIVAPRRVPGLGWKVYLSDYGWTHDAWEKLVEKSPYWAVSTAANYVVDRGWIDPTVEYAVREATTSVCCVERADRFLAKTGTDIKFGGVYSHFLQLPETEPQLLQQLGIDEKFLADNYLLRGGSVLGGASIVARHNRELQLLPSPVGLDERFFWRSLDMDSDAGEQSVLENYLGTVKFKGGEHIWSLRNGLHGYFIMNDKREQVAEVPVQIAQDHENPHDARVIVPYKCVSCHMPKNGIRHFDDVISRMALNPNVGLAVISKGHYANGQLREALEDYYLSDLAREITNHQASYARVVRETTGATPLEISESYVKLIDQYFYAPVDKEAASRELGVEAIQLERYLSQTGNQQLLAILTGEGIPREAFENAFADGMRARIYKWERSPSHVRVPEPPPPADVVEPARPDEPVVDPPVESHPQPVQQPQQYQPPVHSNGNFSRGGFLRRRR